MVSVGGRGWRMRGQAQSHAPGHRQINTDESGVRNSVSQRDETERGGKEPVTERLQ